MLTFTNLQKLNIAILKYSLLLLTHRKQFTNIEVILIKTHNFN